MSTILLQLFYFIYFSFVHLKFKYDFTALTHLNGNLLLDDWVWLLVFLGSFCCGICCPFWQIFFAIDYQLAGIVFYCFILIEKETDFYVFVIKFFLRHIKSVVIWWCAVAFKCFIFFF